MDIERGGVDRERGWIEREREREERERGRASTIVELIILYDIYTTKPTSGSGVV